MCVPLDFDPELTHPNNPPSTPTPPKTNRELQAFAYRFEALPNLPAYLASPQFQSLPPYTRKTAFQPLPLPAP